MSASHDGSPSDAPPVSEDVGARISRLEMHMQQSSEAMRHQAELMESILRRLDTPPLALTGGDEQLAALQELAPMRASGPLSLPPDQRSAPGALPTRVPPFYALLTTVALRVPQHYARAR